MPEPRNPSVITTHWHEVSMPDDALVKSRRAKLKRPRPAGRTPVDTLRHHELRRLANLEGDDRIDLVTIAVRVPSHCELVLAALDAGKAVYSEAPLGRSVPEAP
jgi:predicted dehydrogenase